MESIKVTGESQMKLTSRERMMRIFQNKEIDRPAIKLWGYEPNLVLTNPAYSPVCEAAQKTDLVLTVGNNMDIYCGKYVDN